MLEGDITADTLLNLNMQREAIRDGAMKGIEHAPLPAPVVDAQKKKFTTEQDQFSRDVVDAFTESLHHIFMISASLMAVATVLILAVRERELRTDVHHAGEM